MRQHCETIAVYGYTKKRHAHIDDAGNKCPLKGIKKSKPFVLLEMERFDKIFYKDNHLGMKRDFCMHLISCINRDVGWFGQTWVVSEWKVNKYTEVLNQSHLF